MYLKITSLSKLLVKHGKQSNLLNHNVVHPTLTLALQRISVFGLLAVVSLTSIGHTLSLHCGASSLASIEHQKMTPTSMSTELPDFLFSGWRLCEGEVADAQARGDLDGWTVSSLSCAYLKYQLDRYRDEQHQAKIQESPASLASHSIRRLLETLRSSYNLQADVEMVAESLNFWLQVGLFGALPTSF